MVADFMKYHTKIKISHGCRFHEILHKNLNISSLQIWCDILPQSQYLMERISWHVTPEALVYWYLTKIVDPVSGMSNSWDASASKKLPQTIRASSETPSSPLTGTNLRGASLSWCHTCPSESPLFRQQWGGNWYWYPFPIWKIKHLQNL